jgi:phospholipid/cholesterol/gamma-HCH transport system substrate-binding protein
MKNSIISASALALVAVVGVGYLALDVLDMDPRRDYSEITVPLTTSGGLTESSRVTLRGMAIGTVDHVDVGADGLRAVVRVDASQQIPTGTEVKVSNLSAAGEQFLDFRPASTSGPYLRDGDTVAAENVDVSPSVSDTLAVADALTAEIDSNAIGGIVNTVDVATRGRESDVDNIVEVLRLLSLTLSDRKDQVRRLYYNLQVLGEKNYADQLGPRLADSVPELSASGDALEHLINSYQAYSYVGENVWDGELGRLVPKIDEYISQLSPDLGFISTVLRPVTKPLRPLRFDAGALVNMLEQVFPQGGPARVAVTLPDK